MTPTLINIPERRGKPTYQRIEVEGQQLAALIDLAAGDCKDVGEKEILFAKSDEAVVIMTTVLDTLKKINGSLAVQNISPELLTLLTDCYRELKY